MSAIAQDYSGVAINYDNAYTDSLALSYTPVAQTFVLPVNYTRGTNPNEQNIPALSGFQILCHVSDAATAQWSWQIGYTNVASPFLISQFDIVQSGIATGTYTTGFVWFDILFTNPITVQSDQLNGTWVVVLTPSNIDYVTYFTYGNQGFQSKTQGYLVQSTSTEDENTQLYLGDINVESALYPSLTLYPSPSLLPSSSQNSGSAASFNFRLLTLSADEGVDFLGNQYRSYVAATNPNDINSLIANDSYWLSPPLPSSQAVVSQYFDMRTTYTVQQYGSINLVPDPSFEYDTGTPSTWAYALSSGTINSFTVVPYEGGIIPPSGIQMLNFSADNVAANGTMTVYTEGYIPILGGQSYSGLAWVDLTATSITASAVLQFEWYTSVGAGLTTSLGKTQVTNSAAGYVSWTAIAPANATLMRVSIVITNDESTTENLSAYIDSVLAMQSATQVTTYFDGDYPGSTWTGIPGNSASAQIVSPQLIDAPVVVDAINLVPLFPNQRFNIYFSNDDNGVTVPSTTDEWETKLWTLAQSFSGNFGNETVMLNQPITAKYIKVEMTNPQLQSYDPGFFQLPMIYKTFPSWVQNYFLSQITPPTYSTDQITVISDALSTMYTPPLADLTSNPVIPPVPSPTSYTVPQQPIDNTTLSQIDLNTTPYQSPLGSQSNSNTVLSSIVANQLSNTLTGPLQINEGPPSTYPPITTVSSWQRDAVLLDLLTPMMYFYYTCRHQYQLVSATLANNKAYFFGIANINFLRKQGTVIEDTPVYTETGQDFANASVNDFVMNTLGTWDTYAD